MKKIILILVGIGVLVSLTLRAGDQYVEYIPVVQSGDYSGKLTLEKDESLNTVEHQEHIQIILDHYNADWKLSSNGKILISENLNDDIELLWNYTSKANDEKFISEILP